MYVFINFGNNHGRDCYRLLDAETGRVAYSRDVTWFQSETPWIIPIRVAPTELPRDIYVPMPQSVPSPRHFLHPSPLRQLPHRQRHYRHRLHERRTLRLRFPRALAAKIEHEGYVEMPGRTRGDTPALRDASREYAHRNGIPLDHAAMVSMLAKGGATNEIVRQHGASTRRTCRPRCIGPTYTQQCVRRGKVDPCRHMAKLHAPGIQWSFTGRYLRAGAGLAISRERNRC